MKPRQVLDDGGNRVARLAWLISFLATISLIAILALAKSAQAISTPAGVGAATVSPTLIAGSDPAGTAGALPVEVGSEEEDESAEECEEEVEDGEAEAGDCDEEEGPETPAECLLKSTHATVFASGAQDRLRLVIHYSSLVPTPVAIAYGLHGGRGSLYLGRTHSLFSRRGVFRQTAALTEAQMAKVTEARDFTVELHAVGAPLSCRRYFDTQLSVRQASPGGLLWTDPETAGLSR